MTSQTIAQDYDARATVTETEFDALMAEYLDRSSSAVLGSSGESGIVYDEASGQRLDIWGTGPALRPVFFVVHGGYWRALSREHTAFMAKALADAGVATVTIDYGLAPATSLTEIVRQVRAAYAWMLTHGRGHGLDTDRVVVGGSSAGAHLAAMTMVGGEWTADLGVTDGPARCGLLISGLYDLRPLVDAPANDWLFLTPDSAAALSPALAPPPVAGTTAVIADADGEAAGFTRQSADLVQRWSPEATVTPMTIADRNHYDVFLDLADPTNALTAALLDLVATTFTPSGA